MFRPRKIAFVNSKQKKSSSSLLLRDEQELSEKIVKAMNVFTNFFLGSRDFLNNPVKSD